MFWQKKGGSILIQDGSGQIVDCDHYACYDCTVWSDSYSVSWTVSGGGRGSFSDSATISRSVPCGPWTGTSGNGASVQLVLTPCTGLFALYIGGYDCGSVIGNFSGMQCCGPWSAPESIGPGKADYSTPTGNWSDDGHGGTTSILTGVIYPTGQCYAIGQDVQIGIEYVTVT